MGPAGLSWRCGWCSSRELAGSVFVQARDGAAAARLDLEDVDVRIPVLVIVVLGIVTIQVTMVCVWRLLTMVRRGTVFSHAAFRYVDVVFGAVVVGVPARVRIGSLLALGEGVAPGVVLLIGGLALLVAGVALVVLVLRMLLAQAVARDAEAQAPAGRAERGHLMPIVVDVDVMLARRKMAVGALAEQVGITPGQPGGAQERPRQGGALHHAGGPVRGARVPTRRPVAMGAGVTGRR